MKLTNTLLPLILLVLLTNLTCTAQLMDWCGTTEYFVSMMNENPKIKRQVQRNEKLTAKNVHKNLTLTTDTLFIPVVVHVVYNTADQNISDAQILSQINVLNEVYERMLGTRGYNNSPIGSNTRIEFRLAQLDPGNLPTTGIERVQTAVTEFTNSGSEKDNVKFRSKGGADAWRSTSYLNFWVCNLRSGLLGYASFPGGDAKVDGVAVTYKSFGDSVGTSITLPYCLGRTTTHEVGHWLNLYHTFQDGCPNTNCLNEGDKVCDTPPVETPTSGCPPNRASCGGSVLINDYMDYTYDACMNLITEGQNYRVRTTMDYIRNTLKQSPALTNHDFNLFGTHTGNYRYVLGRNFTINSTGTQTPFNIPSGSRVEVRARSNHKVTLGKNTKIMNGAVFKVMLYKN